MSVMAARNACREDIPDEGMSHILEIGQTLKELISSGPETKPGKTFVAKNGSLPGVLVKLIGRITMPVYTCMPSRRWQPLQIF